MKTIRALLLAILLIIFSQLSFGQGTETFTNLTTTSATSYLTRNWTGDNGLAWSSTDSKADQTLTGTAVTLRNGSVTCNTIPGGCGTLTFNYKMAFTGNSTLKVFINGVQYGATITVSSTTPTLASIPVNVTGSFNLELRNATKRTTIDDVSWTAMASGPEINIKQIATNYLTGSTYNYGSATVGSNNDIIFTIENTGATNLTITTPLTITGDYTVIAQPTSPVAAGGTTTFTVRFIPSIAGTRTGAVTVLNNDSDEGSYVINFTGIGVAGSSSSDIISNTTFVYPTNIDYTLYPPTANITTANSIEVYQFDIRDGGATTDVDALTTQLTAITFSITNSTVIDRIALYDGTIELAEVAGATSPSFSGLAAIAADNGNKTLSLRVTFKTTVTDNTQFSFTVTSATADVNGSVFALSNAGGATSSVIGNNNRIEIIATTIAWGTQPANQTTNTNLSPITVNAVDANGNIDLDENTCSVAITTTGIGITSSSPYTFVNGVATMSNIQFSSANTAITLTATAQACLGNGITTSTTFDITVFTYFTGDWRTTAANTGLGINGSGWESFNGTIWTIEATAPQNIVSAPSRIIIRHTNCDGGDNVGTGTRTFPYNDIIITSGGELVLNGNKTGSIISTWNPFIATGKKIEVQSGGILRVQGDIDMGSSTRSLNVLDGGKMYLNQSTIINTHMMWAGTEDFQDNSEIIIQDWDWAIGTATKRSFLNPTYQIPTNSSGNGYKIGNLTYNCTVTTQNQTILPALSAPLNFCNNLVITNNSTVYSISLTANKVQNPIATIGGNVTVNEGTLNIGINYTNLAIQQLTILGNLNVNYADATNPTVVNIHNFGGTAATIDSVKLRLQGNLTVASGAIFQTGPDANSKLHSYLILNGSNSQTINGGGTIALTNVEINKTINHVTLNRNFTVTDSLFFINNNFILGANTLQLGSTSIGVQIGGSTSSYVVTDGTGLYKRVLLANSIAYTFPLGPNLSSYNPAILNYTGTIDDFSARVEIGINPISNHDLEFVNRTWNISESVVGGTNASLTLQWDVLHENASFVRTTSNIYHYTSGNWVPETFFARNLAVPYTCTDNAITSFSPFIVGNNTVTLPVELLYFNANPKGKIVELSWATLTEINNDYFEIERSIDGEIFTPISTKKGAGNSTQRINYLSFDFNPNQGINYYRLKQIDFNGNYSYSSIKVVSFYKEKEPKLLQYDNTVLIKNNFDNAIIYLYNIDGRLIISTNNSSINTTHLSKGIYTIHTLSNVKEKHWKIIVR